MPQESIRRKGSGHIISAKGHIKSSCSTVSSQMACASAAAERMVRKERTGMHTANNAMHARDGITSRNTASPSHRMRKPVEVVMQAAELPVDMEEGSSAEKWMNWTKNWHTMKVMENTLR